MHDLSKYSLTEFRVALITIRAIEVLIRPSVPIWVTLRLGCIIRGAIVIIMSIGST